MNCNEPGSPGSWSVCLVPYAPSGPGSVVHFNNLVEVISFHVVWEVNQKLNISKLIILSKVIE